MYTTLLAKDGNSDKNKENKPLPIGNRQQAIYTPIYIYIWIALLIINNTMNVHNMSVNNNHNTNMHGG